MKQPFNWRYTPGLSSFTAAVVVFLYAPLFILVAYAFNSNRLVTVWSGFSVKWFVQVADNSDIRSAAFNSVIIAVAATITSTIIATAGALGLQRGTLKLGRNVVTAMIALPLIVPEIVVAIMTLIFFSAVGMHHGLFNLIIAHTVFCIPFALLPIQARLRDMGGTLEEAGRDLYAGEWQLFRRITLPLLAPAIFSGAIMAFVVSLDNFLISLMVSGAGSTTLPVYVYGMMRLGVTPEVNAISTILFAVSVVLVGAALSIRTPIRTGGATMIDLKSLLRVSLLAMLVFSLAGCSKKESGAPDAGVLHLYNWTDYTSPELIKKFETETGIKVSIDTYDSNETALAKLSSGAAGYDVMIISNDFVPIFVKQNLFAAVEVASMPNFKNLDPRWQKRAWDPDAKYTVPWVWGTTSYSVDTAIYKGPTDSLKALFEPPAELKGKIGMFGSASEVMSLALLYLGKDQNNSNPDDLKALDALLEAQKPFIKVYNSDGTTERQVSGETVMHQQWSGKALAARTQKPTIKYVFPKEGAIGWMDNVAVPASAPDMENAKKFLNFLMDPENIALQQKFTGYQSAVMGSGKYLSADVANSPEFNPPAELKIVFAPTCSEKATKAYDRIWTDLRQ